MSDELREQLAAYAHEAWSGWMKYLFGKGKMAHGHKDGGGLADTEQVWIMPAWAVERWQRQMNTPYADLPEAEKKSDRKEADEILAIVATPTIPPDVAATMREALEFRRDMIHGSDEVNGFTTEGGRTALVRIDAALAWLNAQSPTP